MWLEAMTARARRRCAEPWSCVPRDRKRVMLGSHERGRARPSLERFVREQMAFVGLEEVDIALIRLTAPVVLESL